MSGNGARIGWMSSFYATLPVIDPLGHSPRSFRAQRPAVVSLSRVVLPSVLGGLPIRQRSQQLDRQYGTSGGCRHLSEVTSVSPDQGDGDVSTWRDSDFMAASTSSPAIRSLKGNDPDRSIEDRAALGKAARSLAPRAAHEEWEVSSTRPDPVALLESQAESRVQELVPIRYGRMLVSPFTFFRGAARIMASDLSTLPVRLRRSGVR